MSTLSQVLAGMFLLFTVGGVTLSMFWVVYQMNKNDTDATTKEKTL